MVQKIVGQSTSGHVILGGRPPNASRCIKSSMVPTERSCASEET